MRICFHLTLVGLALGGTACFAASSVVRADARSGRLIRTVPAPADSVTRSNVHEAIAETSRRHDVDPLLVQSMISVESAYDPFAISPKGAQGLMQLIPSTARRFGVDDAFNPAQNIEGGVKYLKHLLTLYAGDTRLALAAYNAGEGAVAKYRGKIPPYAETQNYVYQVGKRLGEARRTVEAPVKKEAPRTDGYSRIVKSVAADGSVFYRTER